MRRLLFALSSLSLLLALVAQDAQVVGAAPAREPVIVLPGLAGSEFTAARAFHLNVDNGHGGIYSHDYGANEKVWVNVLQIALPGADDYLDALKLQPDGRTAVAPDLIVSGIYQSTYGDLVDYLQRQGYALGRDLFVFAYDWRRDLSETVELLDAQVTHALVAANGGVTDPAHWQVHQVDLVAHSMGGVLGRLYISDPVRARQVDQLITFGSPQLGAVNLLKGLLYGDDFGTTTLGLGLNPEETKDLVQNMPGPIQLLPSRSYYAYYDNSDAAHFSPFVQDRDLNGDGVAEGVLGPEALREMLLGLGANRMMLDMAGAFQSQFDGRRLFLPLLNGAGQASLAMPPTVRWQALIGFGYPAIGQIREYIGLCDTTPCTKHDELPVDGDGTVALLSAAIGDPNRGRLFTTAVERWYAERTHSGLVQRDYLPGGLPFGDGSALVWLGALLRGDPVQTIPGIFTTPPPGLSGVSIAALGPAALRVSNTKGQQVGRARGAEPIPPTLPGASYDRLPDGEFVFLKGGGIVELAAERASSADLKLRVWQNGRLVRTAVYLGVRLGPSGRAMLALPEASTATAPDRWPALRVDADGDGVFEAEQPLTALLDERESLDTTPPTIVISPTAGAPTGLATPRWQVRDDGAGVLRVLASVDGGPSSDATEIERPLAPGRHTVRVVALDRAGNTRSREFTWSVP
jgi:hypothetical protein